ncbi:MAG: hypothetical protein WC475_04235 [Candidatus Paceibacterota bacterium]
MKNINIPDTFMGKPIKGAMDEILKEQEKKAGQIPQKSQTQINAPSLDGFIYVPSVDLYFQKEKQFNNYDWHQAHEKLQKQGLRMPTIEEFRQFLSYLKYNPSAENSAIYRSIAKIRSLSSSEWLDAYFEKQGNELYILTQNKRKIEKLDDCLMKNKAPGIDIDEWLMDATRQGFPKPDIKIGDLHHLSQLNNSVARFYADSDCVGLYCNMGSVYFSPNLGVRGVFGVQGAKTK